MDKETKTCNKLVEYPMTGKGDVVTLKMTSDAAEAKEGGASDYIGYGAGAVAAVTAWGVYKLTRTSQKH